MPKDDWKKSSIPTLFEGWDAWPWVDGPNDAPDSVLDVACGLSLKSKFVQGARTRVGFDLHRPYLEAAREQNPLVNWIPVQGDVTKISECFLPGSFDLVLALDIIEHVEKDQALKLLADLEEIARVAVVLETPRGFLPQDMDILGFGQDHLQTHRCGFEKEELEELGYQVFVRDYQLAPIQRVKGSTEVQTECQLLNAIKRVDGGAA
jgi:SAM-dependent methyltransferase